AQIIDVLDFTREEFGEAKYLEYRELISLALTTLAATPTAGKHRHEIHCDAWTYHIARPVERRGTCSSIVSATSSRLPVSCTTRWTCRASGRGNGSDANADLVITQRPVQDTDEHHLADVRLRIETAQVHFKHPARHLWSPGGWLRPLGCDPLT